MIRALINDQEGAVAVLAALALPALLGFGALAVDLGYARVVETQLQAAADAAALAASQKLPDTTAARTAALDLAAKNTPSGYGTIIQSSDVSFGRYDPSTQVFTSGAANPNAVQVQTSRTVAKGNQLPTFLAGILTGTPLQVSRVSIAFRDTAQTYCVIVLDPNSVGALSVNGGGTFQVPNCGVQVNSGHNKAASAGNATNVVAKKFCLVGGYNGSFSPTPDTGCAALADPLSAVPEPAAPNGGTCYTGATPLPNQTYCGTITLNNSVTLSPGIYYFKGATVTFGTGANLTGTGVMFFFDANSSMDLSSNGTVNLTAPSSGTYAGISMFQSRSATTNNTMKMTGGANFIIDGTIYMPKASLQLTGNSDVSVNSKTGYVITNKLSFTGSSTFSVGTWGGVQAYGSNNKAALVQ